MKKTRACKIFESYWNRAPHGQPWSPRDTNTTPEKQFYPGKQFHALELCDSQSLPEVLCPDELNSRAIELRERE